MLPVEWQHYRLLVVTLRVTFAVKTFFHIPWNTAYIIYNMFTCELESAFGW